MFDSIQDMVLLLRAVKQDRHIKVVRVKNRMSEAYDARQTGGYRDVLVNICVVYCVYVRVYQVL